MPDNPIARAKAFSLLPSKILFLIYNSHDLKKSVGNLILLEVRNFKLITQSFLYDKYRLGVTSYFSLPRQALEKIFGVI